MALNLSNLSYWMLLGGAAGLLLLVAFIVHLRWWPAWPLRIVIIAIALAPALAPKSPMKTSSQVPVDIMLVDQSDSLDPQARSEIASDAQDWLGEAAGRVVIPFAANTAILVDAGQAWPEMDGQGSQVETALEKASLILANSPGRLILVSDGLVDHPEQVIASLQMLIQAGNQVEVRQLPGRDWSEDAAVGPLIAPSLLWQGMPFHLFFNYFPAKNDLAASFQLLVNEKVQDLQVEEITPGFFRFTVPSLPSGVATLEVRLIGGNGEDYQDTFSENNASFASLQVFPPPAVLLVTEDPISQSATKWMNSLEKSGITIRQVTPKSFPIDLEALEDIQVIVLNDFLASQLDGEQMMTLQVFVERLGGGLVILGGRNSYTLGGYAGTILEPLLPVKLEPPPRSDRPPVLFLLVMDASGSMGLAKGDAPEPIELAREAAMRTIEALKPIDTVGVLSFSTSPQWRVSRQEIGDGLNMRQILDSISGITDNTGTRMLEALNEVLRVVQTIPDEDPAARTILLLSDGLSFDGTPPEFYDIARQFSDLGFTLSTIALGEEADQPLLSEMARVGKGRFYAVSLPEDLPRIMISESQAARAENIQEGDFAIRQEETQHPILYGLSQQSLPRLSGYNALSSLDEEGAENILVSDPFGDPLLASWQAGLGRVMTWTSDIGEQWTGAFHSPLEEQVFWSQVIRYALPNPASRQLQANIQSTQGELVVDAIYEDSQGGVVNLADLTFSMSGVDGQVKSYPLYASGLGQYHLEIPSPPAGAYRAILSYPEGQGKKAELPIPFSINSPEEWRHRDLEEGRANLSAWSELADSSSHFLVEAESGGPSSEEPSGEGDLLGKIRDAAGWLIPAILIVFWSVEIAIRRRWLPWSKSYGGKNAK